jgi:gamma-glutamyltranspeptidase/glutathione hydrolase
MDAEMAIASPHWRATEAGNRVLAESGSAVDAAIAAAAVLTVVYPHMVTLGGDAFALLGDADGAIVAANGSGAYAADASVDEVRRRNDGRMPTYGVDTITLPGGVAAWRDMHARAGRLPWPELFTEAIELARDGMEVAGALARDLDALRDKLVQDPGIREVFFDEDGVPASEGDHIRQPRLAESLSRIAEEGAEALYGGAVGSRLIEGLAARGSALTLEDLRRHRTEFVEPISVSYRGHEVVTTPPNSQGFVLLQMLEVLTDLGLTDALGSERADRLARLFAIGNRQRVQHLGDPRATEVDVAGLLARPRIDEILSGLESTPDAGPRDPRPTGDTIAIVATDRFGASISLIQSIFFAFGSMVLEPTTGILLQNRGSSFSLEPGRTSTLRPGARPPHTLMPVMLRKDDEIVGVLGTMGGPSQAQIHAQLIQRLINGDDPQDVVSATRWVVGDYGDGPGDTVLVEERCAPDLRRDLAASGLPLVVGSEWDDRVGHSQVIMRAPGPIRVGTDPRADAKAKR